MEWEPGVCLAFSCVNKARVITWGRVLCRKRFPKHRRGRVFLALLFPGAQPKFLFRTNDTDSSEVKDLRGDGLLRTGLVQLLQCQLALC